MAIKKISANLLGNNAVTAASIAGGAISAADIADNSITAAKISTSTFAIDSLTVNTSDLVVDTANNRVGIGTASPGNLLEINGTGDIVKAGNGTRHLYIAPDSGGFALANGASQTGEAIYFSEASGYLGFNTNSTQRMKIISNGNVGIAIDVADDPQKALHVKNTSSTVGSAQVILEGTAAGYGTGISFQSLLTGGSLKEMARIVADGSNSWNTTTTTQDARLTFYTTGDGTETAQMALHSNGLLILGESPASNTARGTGFTRQLIKMGDNQAYLELQGYDANEEVGMLMSSGSTGNYGQITYNLQYDNLRLNAKSVNRVYISENATEGAHIRANSWWNSAPNNIGGSAMEIGFVGGYAYCLGYDRINSAYKNVLVDGYTIGFATSGTTRAEVNGYGITPYQDNAYDLGTQATTAHWRRGYFKGMSSAGESDREPALSTSGQGGIHFADDGVSKSTGITWAAGNAANTQAGITCHRNNSNGTTIRMFTTDTYSIGPQGGFTLRDDGVIFFNRYGSGSLSTGSGGVITASDGRFKTKQDFNINGIEKVKLLNPTFFTWNEDSEYNDTNRYAGFIAQEVHEVLPEAAHKPELEETKWNYDDRALIAILTKAVQEQQTLIEALQARLDSAGL